MIEYVKLLPDVLWIGAMALITVPLQNLSRLRCHLDGACAKPRTGLVVADQIHHGCRQERDQDQPDGGANHMGPAPCPFDDASNRTEATRRDRLVLEKPP